MIAESEIGSGRGHRVVFGVILGTVSEVASSSMVSLSTAMAASPENGATALWRRRSPETRRSACRASNAAVALSAVSTPSVALAAWKNCTRTFTKKR